jgi:hypothetical protein
MVLTNKENEIKMMNEWIIQIHDLEKKEENEIKLMSEWIIQIRGLVKKTGVPKNIEVGDEYILYEVGLDDLDPFEDAEDSYFDGWRLVSTKAENIPDYWGTGYALKLVK